MKRQSEEEVPLGKKIKLEQTGIKNLPDDVVNYLFAFLRSSPSSLWKFSQASKFYHQLFNDSRPLKNWQLTRDFYTFLSQYDWYKDFSNYSIQEPLTININSLIEIINHEHFDPNTVLLTSDKDHDFLKKNSGNTPLSTIGYLFKQSLLKEDDAFIIVEALLKKKADPNRPVVEAPRRPTPPDSDELNVVVDYFPLHLMLTGLKLVELLLEYNADPNVRLPKIKGYEGYGDTFLEYALDFFDPYEKERFTQCIRSAICYGYDIANLKDKLTADLIDPEHNPGKLPVAQWLEEQQQILYASKNSEPHSSLGG